MDTQSNEKNFYSDMPLHARVERIYVQMDYVIRNEAHAFSDKSKANMRKIMAELQRIRLLLMDDDKKTPVEPQ